MPGPRKPIDRRSKKKGGALAAPSSSPIEPKIKSFPLAKLPEELLTEADGAISDYLDYADLNSMAQASGKASGLFSIFQQQLTAPLLVEQVVQGKQPQIKAALNKAKKDKDPDLLLRLLQKHSIVTDYSNRTFKEPALTAFQAAYWARDEHMMRMLTGSKLFLLSLGSGTLLSEAYKERARDTKTPILIKKDQEYFIYGYNDIKDVWEEAKVSLTQDDHKLIDNLPFEQNELKDSGNFLTPELRELLKGSHRQLEKYLPDEERDAQLQELKNNKIKHGLVLMSWPVNQDIDIRILRSLVTQNNNKPLLIRQGYTLQLYGYNFEREAWELSTPANPEVFRNLHFPNLANLNRCSLLVREKAPTTAEDIEALFPMLNEGSSGYVLVQEPGKLPTELYFIDRNAVPPSSKKIDFPINQNIHTFTKALYPNPIVEVGDDGEERIVYTNIPELDAEQLLKINHITGQPLTVVDATTLTEAMYEELAKGHTQGTEHGLHYDDNRLKEALQIYRANVDNWNDDQCIQYWCEAVGGAQCTVAVNVANEYCHPKRSFDPRPDFKESHLPRELSFYNWVTDKVSSWFPLALGRGLGFDFAIIRGARTGGRWGVGGDDLSAASPAHLDMTAVSRLCEVRNQYLVELKQPLLNQALELAPRL